MPRKRGERGLSNSFWHRESPEKSREPHPWDVPTPEKSSSAAGASSIGSIADGYTPEKHIYRKGKGAGKSSSSGKGGKKGSDSVKQASSSDSPAKVTEGGVEVKRPKEDVASEIDLALRRSHKLKGSDFDKLVRQYLHAIHGHSGKQGCNEALLMVNFYTSKKTRESVRNWPAYMSQLLRKYFESLKAEQREAILKGQREAVEESLRAQGLASGEITDESTAVNVEVLMSAIVADAGANKDLPLAKTSATGPWTDRHLKVPDRVQVGQLMDRELHSEFVCRVCLELCQDAIMLPCSHLFCRDCTKTLVGWKSVEEDIACPACRSAFKPSQVDLKAPMSGWLTRWINNMQVCCAFVSPARLPDADEDPLPPEHAVRQLGLECDWIGPVSAYNDHICKTCTVSTHLRKLQCDIQPCAKSESAVVSESTASSIGPQLAKSPSHKGENTGLTATPSVGSQSSSVPRASAAPIGQDTGDFIVMTRFADSSADTMMPVEAGDHVYISKVDASGWARGSVLGSGRQGWLPYAFCKRRTHTVAVAAGAALTGYLDLKRGDHLVVYHRDMHGWAYGASLCSNQATSPPGWFPEKALGGVN